MNKELWSEKLSLTYSEYGCLDGYKLLYCPWETIEKAKVAFISLNPGEPPEDADLEVISDERGNSYEVEMLTTKSPITEQFLKLCEYIQVSPNEVLTGTICPFRSKDWNFFINGYPFSDKQKEIGLKLGMEFWSDALKHIDLIITVGDETTKSVIDIINAKKILEINSGWGNIKIRKYINSKNKTVIHLPHLSRFRLFSRAECQEPLEKVFFDEYHNEYEN